MIDRVGLKTSGMAGLPREPMPTPAASSFAKVLEEQLGGSGPVRFSAHAQERLSRRNVTLSGEDHVRLGAAVDQLATKGSKESLVLMDRMALLVSVPKRTVITVVPQCESNASIFTNIDSAVVVPPSGATFKV